MSKPFIHSQSSAKKFGGDYKDYMDIHNWMDQTKGYVADARHRAILHSSFGCMLAEQVFGFVRTNSAGRTYSVRDVAEQHIMEDLGWIPTMQDYLQNLPIESWMYKRKMKVSDLQNVEIVPASVAQPEPVSAPDLKLTDEEGNIRLVPPKEVYLDGTKKGPLFRHT